MFQVVSQYSHDMFLCIAWLNLTALRPTQFSTIGKYDIVPCFPGRKVGLWCSLPQCVSLLACIYMAVCFLHIASISKCFWKTELLFPSFPSFIKWQSCEHRMPPYRAVDKPKKRQANPSTTAWSCRGISEIRALPVTAPSLTWLSPGDTT